MDIERREKERVREIKQNTKRDPYLVSLAAESRFPWKRVVMVVVDGGG